MFVALRDIIHAKGRFGLVVAVVGLITLLVVMLSGLTGGLGKQNTSALESLEADAFMINSSDGEHAFASSRVTREDIAEHEGPATDALPLGTAQTSLDTPDGRTNVAVLSLPEGTEVAGGAAIPRTGAVASQELLDDGASPGTDVRLGGEPVTIADNVADKYYSHSPVMWVSTQTWRDVTRADHGILGSVLVLNGEIEKDDPDVLSESAAFSALPAYDSEQGSLQMIQAFLYVISALVIVSFLTVWTIQRTRDLSVLRALGATPGYLFRDALGQAALVLLVGSLLGAGIGGALGWLVAGVVPFEMSVSTVALPAAGVFVLGMLGALLATRRVTRVDPLVALNA
ncbi:ABC transporter permease [Corynebacterium yudongzhengii]|uniref:ABC transporter permease n=1 Tax=Corynebacterium yudongzhengii TaxID=2080740 RepID=A0A2U1T415_9CORY|nr:ABC transporter permease [Corynebacterium yudongzhengii]AWB82847.1 ABC transporter permease [Corynebacterium yudongzhengii]PWC00750.1 ABC transporter permease [Corynebacterium yudongzhengii]